MKWAKERDSLIAQTRAFVNSVIAWKADTMPPPGEGQAVAIENTFAVTPAVTSPVQLSEQVEATAPPDVIQTVEGAVVEEPIKMEPAPALPTAELPSPVFALPRPQSAMAQSPKPQELDLEPSEFPLAYGPSAKDALPAQDTVQNDVRKEIQSRVAAFQAHQHRFAREREVYFKSVLTKARSAIDGKRDGGDEPSA